MILRKTIGIFAALSILVPTVTYAADEINTCVKITAQYDGGVLQSVQTETISTEDVEYTENTDTYKTFYWESLDSMKPLSVSTPAPSESAAPDDEDIEESYVFTFGVESADGAVAVAADTAYGEHTNGMTYGLVDIDDASAINDIKFDGFSDDVLTYPISGEVNGTGYIAASYNEYDADTLATFGDGVIPIRFAVNAEKQKYYTVSATIVNTSLTDSTEVSLFAENRNAVLYNYTLAPGEKITEEWNVNLVGQYYNSTGEYIDEAINIAVAGENVGLSQVTVKKHKSMGKTIWLMTDSTGDNSSADLPYFGLRGKCGVGQVLLKHLNRDIAVSNQGEGGLTSSDSNHLNNALQYMREGDYLYVQYGFNGETTTSLTNNLPKYYEAAHEIGAKLIVVSTTERQNSSFWDSSTYSWTASNADIAAAGKAYVEEMIENGADDIAFIDLNTAMSEWMNKETVNIMNRRVSLGFADENPSRLAMNYYFGYDRDSGVDSVHINDAGADNAAYLIMNDMKETISEGGVQAEVLAELAENAPEAEPYTVSDEILAKGWVPNDSYPYPLPSDVSYEYPTIVKSAEITDGKAVSMSVMVQGDMQYYALGAADILDADGNVIKTVYTQSTDINPLIDHIDNTACSYGEVYTMYFDTDETEITENQSIRFYTAALESGSDEPLDVMYSSYYIPDDVDTVLLYEDFADGIDNWSTAGSAQSETAYAEKDGRDSIMFTENGSGTYNLYRRFDDKASASNGIIKLHFMINYSYGSFTVKLTPDTRASSYVNGAKLINLTDGTVTTSDGTEVGQIKTGKWTDIDCVLNLIDGTETVAIAGGTPITSEITALQSEDVSDVSSYLPLNGLAVAYMSTGSTIPSYSFEAYMADVTVESLTCNMPEYTVSAALSEDSEETGGTISGAGTYTVNETVTLTAKAADDYEFAGWYDADGSKLSSSSSYSFRIRSDKTLYAKFEEAVYDPNVTKWSFSAFDGENEVAAAGTYDTEYNGLTLHINSGDSITAEGLYWSAPGGIKSDGTTTVTNNRYIEFTPEESGTISITFKGNLIGSNNKPRIYISCGDSLACTTKDANNEQLEANKVLENAAGDGQYATMTAELTAGQHYYIWAYYYEQSGANFTISNITYDTSK